MKASFKGFPAVAERKVARSGFALAALVAAGLFATTSVAAQPSYWAAAHRSVDPIIDKHDFINPGKSPDAASNTIELEKLFWMCDYAATSGGLEAHEIEMCGAVTQQLQRVKFEDDFDELLAWWRVNKEAQHLALAGAGVIGYCAQGDRA